MATNPEALVRQIERVSEDPGQKSSINDVIEFYDNAGMDYEHWSKGLNMHLGFYRWGLNPFAREVMLEQLNLEVATRLRLDAEKTKFLIDLGCGMGAIGRSVARNNPKAIIKGVTISPSQVEIAVRSNAIAGLQGQIEILRADYTELPFDDHIADGVWAVESACYAKGSAKENLILEMARVLKTGGRFVVADCFVKQPAKRFNHLIKKCYSATCKNWALSEMATLEHFGAALERNGFRDIIVEDISWRAAPSLAHAPFAVFTFVLKKLLSGGSLKRHNINNLKASLLALALGMNRSKFSYVLISGKLHK